MIINSPLIVCLRNILHDETKLSNFEAMDWELIVRQARKANLLSRTAYLLREKKILASLPDKARGHFISALCVYDANVQAYSWEVGQINSVLSEAGVPCLLLKGVAYIESNLMSMKGRVFSDVDIMVPKDQLKKAERALIKHGWITSDLDPYNQKYYRLWMHEIPPMTHLTRHSNLDIHHSILPPTAKLKPDNNKFWESSISLEKNNLYTLSQVDIVLHSATHLFHEGEFDNGLRDLTDLDLLLGEFSIDQNFWVKLLNRAREQGLGRPLFYAMRYSNIFLQTDIPANVLKDIESEAPPKFLVYIMDFLFLRALLPNHVSCSDQWTGLARWILYIRSHLLRMPLYLLIPHLLRKSWMGFFGKKR